MKDAEKTKEQLLNELVRMRQRIAELEASETERKRVEQELQHTLENLRKAMGATIQAMALAVETKDPYTADHQRRATNLACAIAKEMGLSKEQIDGIRMAGAIHDLGKISVPSEILSKPGRLSEIEFNLVKTHPQVGCDILERIEFPWSIVQIVLQHHERMDGSGYPKGLVGEEILLGARILAVADVVGAMSSHRPYRPALGIDRALEEISRNRGVVYDPKAVDACLKVFTERGFKFEYGDEESDFTKEHVPGPGFQPWTKSVAPTSDMSETMGVEVEV